MDTAQDNLSGAEANIAANDRYDSFSEEACDEEVNETAEYRNIVQLWHPAREKPHCIGALLCWRRDGTHFVHEHFDHDERNWRMFISEFDVLRYCYISNLEPDSFS